MQLRDNMIDSSAAGHAALSQNFVEHLHGLIASDLAAFDERT